MNNFDKFCNKIIKEQYNITAREVLYRRYGKNVADKMISKIKARGNDEYLNQKYVLPDYSEENLDRIIPVIFKDLPEGSSAMGIPKDIPFVRQAITVAPKHGEAVAKELSTGEITNYTTPYDILGHETTHTLQKGLQLNPKNMFEYPLQYEFAPVLGEIKRWYYNQTGILLDADSTDSEINVFINYCIRRNIFNKVPYGNSIDFEKLLRTSEGKEVFRRIVKQTSMKSDTRVA